MGLYDEVWIDEGLPGFPLECRRFQTQSLDNCMDRYVITKEGRLCMVGNVLFEDIPVAAGPEGESRVDIDFHGDIRLVAEHGKYEEYIARFTHGTFEWIREMAEVPRYVRPAYDTIDGS
jgi:hypothetical protein